MTLLLTLLVLAVAVAVAAVATGRITGGLDAPASSLPARPLPAADVIDPIDVELIRFSPALRGYRMEEVDRALDRLATELARRDDVIAGLRHRLGEPVAGHAEPEDLDEPTTLEAPDAIDESAEDARRPPHTAEA